MALIYLWQWPQPCLSVPQSHLHSQCLRLWCGGCTLVDHQHRTPLDFESYWGFSTAGILQVLKVSMFLKFLRFFKVLKKILLNWMIDLIILISYDRDLHWIDWITYTLIILTWAGLRHPLHCSSWSLCAAAGHYAQQKTAMVGRTSSSLA